MTILMKTNRYYTDGSLKQSGVTYTVKMDWGKNAIERGWASDVGGVLPETPAPAGLTAAETVSVQALVTTPKVFARPYRIATWGQERAYAESAAPEITGNARYTDIRSNFWFTAFRGDAQIIADYGIGNGSTGVKAVDWDNTSRSQGKTFSSLAGKCIGGQIDAILMNYGGTDIVLGDGTTPTAATITGYLQANILAFFRLGVPVIFESIYPYMDVAVYRGVSSGWTAQGTGTAAQKQAIADDVNSAMKLWLAQFPRQAIYVDVATALKAGGAYASKNYMIDGIELNLRGAMLVGEIVAKASEALLPLRRSHYFDPDRALTPNAIALLTTGFSNYGSAAGVNGTVTWSTPTFGVDADYGIYLDTVATCSAITGLTAKNITSVSWAAGRLSFTVASHAIQPTQRIKTTGLTSSTGVDLTGPFTIDQNDSETVFSTPLITDPGTITIAGSPPSSSATIVVQEAVGQFNIFTEFIKNNGTPAKGITLSAGDLLQSSCWLLADDGAGGTPPLNNVSIRQRLYYQAGTPTYILSDGGVFASVTGQPAFQKALGPVRMTTPPMVSSNTSGGGSANIANSTGSQLQIGIIFNATGTARVRVYSPSFRAIQAGPIAITTPASGSAYTNKFGRPIRVIVDPNGATITAATMDRGDANSLYSLGGGILTGGDVILYPGDRLILTYSAATPILTGIAQP